MADIDLDVLKARAHHAHQWLLRDTRAVNGDDFLPLSLRTHFEHDVPLFAAEIVRLRNLVEEVTREKFRRVTAAEQSAHDLRATVARVRAVHVAKVYKLASGGDWASPACTCGWALPCPTLAALDAQRPAEGGPEVTEEWLWPILANAARLNWHDSALYGKGGASYSFDHLGRFFAAEALRAMEPRGGRSSADSTTPPPSPEGEGAR